MSTRRKARARAVARRILRTGIGVGSRERWRHMSECSECGRFLDWHHGDPADGRVCDECRDR
jgi:hypothetical protein